jgi:hypothetical protein
MAYVGSMLLANVVAIMITLQVLKTVGRKTREMVAEPKPIASPNPVVKTS